MTILRSLPGQFFLYIATGGTAAVVDFGSYFLLLSVGAWYVAASVTGNILGFLTAFLVNKYLVFRKREDFFRHFVRFLIVDLSNSVINTGFLFALVEWLGVDPHPAKFIAFAPVLLWNFLLYKFVVYV